MKRKVMFIWLSGVVLMITGLGGVSAAQEAQILATSQMVTFGDTLPRAAAPETRFSDRVGNNVMVAFLGGKGTTKGKGKGKLPKGWKQHYKKAKKKMKKQEKAAAQRVKSAQSAVKSSRKELKRADNALNKSGAALSKKLSELNKQAADAEVARISKSPKKAQAEQQKLEILQASYNNAHAKHEAQKAQYDQAKGKHDQNKANLQQAQRSRDAARELLILRKEMKNHIRAENYRFAKLRKTKRVAEEGPLPQQASSPAVIQYGILPPNSAAPSSVPITYEQLPPESRWTQFSTLLICATAGVARPRGCQLTARQLRSSL